MAHHTYAITGILLAHVLFFGVPALAQDVTVDTVDTTSAEWTECLRLLRLDKDIAERGTYRVRMVKCVNEKIRQTEVGDIDQEHRLSLRARKVQEAFVSGRLGATARSVDTRHFTNRNFKVQEEGITVFFQKLTPTPSNASNNRPRNFVRPSRRLIKQQARLQQTRASKARDSKAYQQRWKEAVDACKAISNSFHRDNCVRARLR